MRVSVHLCVRVCVLLYKNLLVLLFSALDFHRSFSLYFLDVFFYSTRKVLLFYVSLCSKPAIIRMRFFMVIYLLVFNIFFSL